MKVHADTYNLLGPEIVKYPWKLSQPTEVGSALDTGGLLSV